MAFTKHVKSFGIYQGSDKNYDTPEIQLISDYRIQQQCEYVFDWIMPDFKTNETSLPNYKHIDDILGGFTVVLPTHQQLAACLLYKNKIKNNILYCQRDLLPFFVQCCQQILNIESNLLLTKDHGEG